MCRFAASAVWIHHDSMLFGSSAPHRLLQLSCASTVCWSARCVGSWVLLSLFCLHCVIITPMGVCCCAPAVVNRRKASVETGTLLSRPVCGMQARAPDECELCIPHRVPKQVSAMCQRCWPCRPRARAYHSAKSTGPDLQLVAPSRPPMQSVWHA